jgi:glutamyl-tRNA synthetase
VNYSEEAAAQLKQKGASTCIDAILTALDSLEQLTQTSAADMIKQVIKEENLKKG